MNGYVIAGWVATYGVLGIYALRVVRRERVLRRVAQDDLGSADT